MQLLDEFERLSGRHFIHRIPVPQESKFNIVKRTCKVCSVAVRENDRCLWISYESALDEKPVTNVNSVKLLYVLTSALKYIILKKDYY